MDFVLLWVNNKDPEWLARYQQYSVKEKGIKNTCRFRDWDNLKYWFRGIEKYADWVEHVFFITDRQIPDWMNVHHPKLKIVFHDEYIPHEFLPTFSSNTIEMFLHRIPDLSERFVLFNDDFFIINKLSSERFFRNGLPCDISAFDVYPGYGLSTNNMCNLELLNRNISKNESLRKYFWKWFSVHNGVNLFRTLLLMWWPYFVGFLDPHLPQPFLKSVFKEVWEKEGIAIRESLKSPFRQRTNITQYLMRYWQLATGRYANIDLFEDSTCFHLEDSNLHEAVDCIVHREKSIIVINDTEKTNFVQSKDLINNAFECVFPDKSSFEK